MFDEIGKINWAELKQANGYSGHVPEAIKGLISADKLDQEASYWKLDNHVVLQGDLYQAAFYVVPFLLEILASKVKNGRAYTYDLLFEIANGFALEETPCVYNGDTLPLTEACKSAVVGGVDLYLNEVSNISSTCRENSLELLVSLGERAEYILINLQKIEGEETDSYFRSKLKEAIVEIRL